MKYFRQATAITADPPDTELKTIVEVIEDIWANRDRDYNIRRLVKRLQRINKAMSAEARESFAAHIPNGDVGRYAANLPAGLSRDFTATMALLRNKNFQDLLLNYQRAPRTFLIAHETQDTVSSTWLIRGADGQEYRPEDYLTAFARFVRENPEQIEAIRILLNRPRDWNTTALTELRQKLAATPLRFTEEHLRKAHEIHYRKALVDIISMVKHAVNEEQPLLNAEERVKLAFAKVTAGKSFTPDQQQWLGLIESHLIQNLTIDQTDFDLLPVFARKGGLSQATRVFAGQLQDLMVRLNEAIAA